MAQLKYWNGSTWVNAVVGAQGATGPTGPIGPTGPSAITPVPYRTGQYYRSQISGSGYTITPAANATYYMPIYIYNANTFSSISIATVTGFSGSAVIRLGIYNNNNGIPSTVNIDYGTVNPTVANATYSINTSKTLNEGLYWLAFNATTAATTNNFAAFSGIEGWQPSNMGSSTPSGNMNICYTQLVNASAGFATALGVSRSAVGPIISLAGA